MLRTTIGRVLVNDALPDDLRDNERVLTSDASDKVLAEIAHRYPDRYREISKRLMDLGREGAFQEGATLGMMDMLNPLGKDRDELVAHAKQQAAKIMADKSLTADEKRSLIGGVFGKVQKTLIDATYAQTLGKANPFALQVFSKARGSPPQLTALMTTPGIYMDAEDRVVPVFISRSFAEGLRPHEYWAGTYGARKSVISTKFATRDAGYLGKQFNQAALRLVVTEDDCGTGTGVPVSSEDNDSIGSVLAVKSGKYPAGTVISRPVLTDLQHQGFSRLVVRSPLTCGCEQGICAQCTGLRESGKFPKVGDHVGINGSSPLAERMAQGSLNVKHSGGMGSGKGGGDDYAGFDVIEQLFQMPKVFPHRAAVATQDGRVERIEKAPQGGWHVFIAGEPHYVLPEAAVSVKEGDKVEAGDQLSTGLLNPKEIVQYKGIGEGRRYFAERAVKAFRDSGYAVHRRNMELLTRGLIDHAVVNDPDGLGDSLPGDVVSYSRLAFNYRPRPAAAVKDTASAVGGYLEQPALHYTIGTRVTKKVADELGSFGHNRVMVHSEPPDFEAYVPGLRAVPRHEPDWMAQLGSSYLKANLLKQVHTGGESKTHGLHPVPALAKGTEFGDTEGAGY